MILGVKGFSYSLTYNVKMLSGCYNTMQYSTWSADLLLQQSILCVGASMNHSYRRLTSEELLLTMPFDSATVLSLKEMQNILVLISGLLEDSRIDDITINNFCFFII